MCSGHLLAAHTVTLSGAYASPLKLEQSQNTPGSTCVSQYDALSDENDKLSQDLGMNSSVDTSERIMAHYHSSRLVNILLRDAYFVLT